MSQLWNVFDDKFENEIVFSLNKPARYAPRNLLGALGWSTTPQSDGRCPRQCDPSPCTDLGPECFADISACECYDIEGDPFETTSVRVGGRCEKGVYCTVDIDGNECADCCQPPKKETVQGSGIYIYPQTCRADWRTEKEQHPDDVGEWSQGLTCKQVKEGVGALAAKCAHCPECNPNETPPDHIGACFWGLGWFAKSSCEGLDCEPQWQCQLMTKSQCESQESLGWSSYPDAKLFPGESANYYIQLGSIKHPNTNVTYPNTLWSCCPKCREGDCQELGLSGPYKVNAPKCTADRKLIVTREKYQVSEPSGTYKLYNKCECENPLEECGSQFCDTCEFCYNNSTCIDCNDPKRLIEPYFNYSKRCSSVDNVRPGCGCNEQLYSPLTGPLDGREIGCDECEFCLGSTSGNNLCFPCDRNPYFDRPYEEGEYPERLEYCKPECLGDKRCIWKYTAKYDESLGSWKMATPFYSNPQCLKAPYSITLNQWTLSPDDCKTQTYYKEGSSCASVGGCKSPDESSYPELPTGGPGGTNRCVWTFKATYDSNTESWSFAMPPYENSAPCVCDVGSSGDGYNTWEPLGESSSECNTHVYKKLMGTCDNCVAPTQNDFPPLPTGKSSCTRYNCKYVGTEGTPQYECEPATGLIADYPTLDECQQAINNTINGSGGPQCSAPKYSCKYESNQFSCYQDDVLGEYSTLTDCQNAINSSGCGFQYNCNLVDGAYKCVPAGPSKSSTGQFSSKNSCQIAQQNGSCGKWECKSYGSIVKCEQYEYGDFSTEAECKQKCCGEVYGGEGAYYPDVLGSCTWISDPNWFSSNQYTCETLVSQSTCLSSHSNASPEWSCTPCSSVGCPECPSGKWRFVFGGGGESTCTCIG